MNQIARKYTQYWYQPSYHFLMISLLPFSWIFSLIVASRRMLYSKRYLSICYLPAPTIVVGNIVVGGAGKTPLVIWLAHFLKEQGYKPGIISRGVGAKYKHNHPYFVHLDDCPRKVGDEALLLRRTECPVIISKDRVQAAKILLERASCNIILSDDGLQHYRLGRALEIGVVDGIRKFGNHQLLPVGPLREPISRLKKVNLVVVNGGEALIAELPRHKQIKMEIKPIRWVCLATGKSVSLSEFPFSKVHAVAGIGHPERFFLTLQKLGINEIIPHPFPDHFLYKEDDFDWKDSLPIVMTEKDAVKCTPFADKRYWYLEVGAVILNKDFEENLLMLLKDKSEQKSH